MKGHHVAVRVPSFERAIAWYIEKLDFRVLQQWAYADMQLAFLAPAADNEFVIEILGGGSPPPIPKPGYSDLGDSVRMAGYHHFCINVLDLDATVAELRTRDVTIVTAPFELPVIDRRIAFIADSFGNIIELAQVMV
jgi:catechol 2,3-dioxygenase-like lactoylglutathione lyase family enzyme